MTQSYFLESKKNKYGKHIVDECINFLKLNTGSMIYDYDMFDSYWDAMIDAIKYKGEDIDRVIAFVFNESIDQEIVKRKLLNAIEEETLTADELKIYKEIKSRVIEFVDRGFEYVGLVKRILAIYDITSHWKRIITEEQVESFIVRACKEMNYFNWMKL